MFAREVHLEAAPDETPTAASKLPPLGIASASRVKAPDCEAKDWFFTTRIPVEETDIQTGEGTGLGEAEGEGVTEGEGLGDGDGAAPKNS